MNLYTLGETLLAFFEREALSCDEVVNLAGDRQVVLAAVDPARSRMSFVGDPTTRKAALLGVRRRTESARTLQ